MDDFEPKGFTGCSPFWTASVDHVKGASVHHASENVSRNPSVTLRRNQQSIWVHVGKVTERSPKVLRKLLCLETPPLERAFPLQICEDCE